MVRLDQWGTALGTRSLGKKVRVQLLTLMETEDQPITISFDNIFMISTAFADECFGHLIASIGPKQFREVFIIKDLENKIIKNILNQTVKQRLLINQLQTNDTVLRR